MKCSDCRYYRATEIGQGECLRYPPTLTVMPGTQVTGFRSAPQLASVFPPTKAESRCGEYRGKLEVIE